ncbi:hypothetical protein GQ457_07G045230 [Hibiscus cannabinus]
MMAVLAGVAVLEMEVIPVPTVVDSECECRRILMETVECNKVQVEGVELTMAAAKMTSAAVKVAVNK